MPGRSVLQWIKNDCEDYGHHQSGLAGLGMMRLQDSWKSVPSGGQPVDLAALPKDDPASQVD